MITHLTSAEIAVKIGISERSVQRWIREGRLAAKRLEDSALYEVDTSDLERLRLRGHREEEMRLQHLDRRVADLEAEVEQLHAALAHLTEQLTHLTATKATPPTRTIRKAEAESTTKSPTSPRPVKGVGPPVNKITVRDRADVPADAMPLHQFANQWQINRHTFREQVINYDFPHYAFWNEKRNEEERYFTPTQQQAIFSWWQENGKPYGPRE